MYIYMYVYCNACVVNIRLWIFSSSISYNKLGDKGLKDMLPGLLSCQKLQILGYNYYARSCTFVFLCRIGQVLWGILYIHVHIQSVVFNLLFYHYQQWSTIAIVLKNAAVNNQCFSRDKTKITFCMIDTQTKYCNHHCL